MKILDKITVTQCLSELHGGGSTSVPVVALAAKVAEEIAGKIEDRLMRAIFVLDASKDILEAYTNLKLVEDVLKYTLADLEGRQSSYTGPTEVWGSVMQRLEWAMMPEEDEV